jgi:uncharacterized protein (DUF2141 family)
MRNHLSLLRSTPVLLAALLFAATLVPMAHHARAQAGQPLTFVITGLRTNTGTVRGGIYSSADVWTDVGGQIAVCTSRVAGGTSRCTLTTPGPGRFAFAFYHDADDDHQLDRDMVGIPQEGYGFSNNARPGMGAPSFESAAFDIAGAPYTGRIAALYGWSL